MDVILIMLGIIFGVGLLTMIGCLFYYYEEDKKLDREAAHNLAYVKNFRAQEWCLDAMFWNDLALIYIYAGLYSDANNYMGMAKGILVWISDRF